MHALVAVNGGVVVAYATYTIDFATWRLAPYLHLDCVFVVASHRGNGLGRRLMHVLAGIARQRSCETIEWQTPEWNRPAMAFYSTLGADGSPKVRFQWSLPAGHP